MLVVISRWFGGVLLYNDRFKHINNACRTILINHGYIKKVKEKYFELKNCLLMKILGVGYNEDKIE